MLKANNQSVGSSGSIKCPNQNMSQEHGDAITDVTCTLMTPIMLTLNATTLFYWAISDPPPKKLKYSVESWVKTIPSNIKLTSHTPSLANSVRTGKSSINHYSTASTRSAPALTSAASSYATSSSVLTSEITITSAHCDIPVKVKQDTDSIHRGLSDHEEITGIKRDAAHASPIKGKKWINSEVSTSDLELFTIAYK